MYTKVAFLTLCALALIFAGCPGAKPEPGQTLTGCTQYFPPGEKMPACTSFPNNRCGTCANLSGDTSALCSYLPRDVDFLEGVGYGEFMPVCQKPFDWFSWQTFVALSWPADAQGNPLPGSISDAPDAPRVWEKYSSVDDIFPPGLTSPQRTGMKVLSRLSKGGGRQHFSGQDDLEAFSNAPIIDRNLNFALYEVRVNPVEASYIKRNGLNTYCGQKKYTQTIAFPVGHYPDSIGSIEVKASWRILLPGVDDTTRYYKQRALLVVDKSYVVGGTKAIMDTVWVGLVGMHIIRRVKNDGGAWVWSSFEHVDLAPVCPNGQCPDSVKNKTYDFYNALCSSCKLNQAPDQGKDSSFLWSPAASKGNPKYGRRYANGQYGTQAGRFYPVETSTEEITAWWQKKLSGTVWQNYRLIGSQWRPEEFGIAEAGLPKFEANITLETYLQPTSSCIGCHGTFATTATGKPSDLSFLLGIPDSTNCN